MRSGIGVLIAGALALVALLLPSPASASTAGDPVEAEFNYAGLNIDFTLAQLDQLVVDGTGEPVTLSGSYTDSAGNFTLPKETGLQFPGFALDLEGESLSVSFRLGGDATGNYDASSGAMSLEAPIILTAGVTDVAALPIPGLGSGPLTCEFGPLDVSFSTAKGWPHAGSTFKNPASIQDGALAGTWSETGPAVALEGSQAVCDLLDGILKPFGGFWLAHSSTPIEVMPPWEEPGPPCQLAGSHYLSCISPKCEDFGKIGTYPNCDQVIVDPGPSIILRLSPVRKTLRQGAQPDLKLVVRNRLDMNLSFRVTLLSDNPAVTVKKSIPVKLEPGGRLTKQVPVRVGKRASGKAVITASAAGESFRAVIRIRPAINGSTKSRRGPQSR